MLTIAIITLYTTIRRRGTNQQFTKAIVICGISTLLLLPAIAWYNLRYTAPLVSLPDAEIAIVLACVTLCGFLLPSSITIVYFLFTQPRASTASRNIPSQMNLVTQDEPRDNRLVPTHNQSNIPAPLVFGQDTPWGWLEYSVGNFQGQRLALTRAVVTIGREEESDIWLDDEKASPNHAALTWHQGTVYVTDFNTPNGVLLNKQRIKGSAIVKHGASLQIGSHIFLFEYAEKLSTLAEQDDPLLHHARRNPRTPPPMSNGSLPTVQLSSSQPDVSTERTTPFPSQLLQPPARPHSSPVLLRLPSKPKQK